MTDKITKGTDINHSKLETELNNNGNKTTVNDDEEEENCFLVYFIETTHTFKVYNDGKIELNKTVYYAIKYVLNGGTNPQGQVTSFKGGETVNLLNATKDNAYFQGWYENSNFSTDRLTSISDKNEDITLYAKWINETPTDYFTWTTTADSATITGFSTKGLAEYNASKLTELAFPKMYNNLTVTAIKDYAFDGRTALQELIIPDNITSIGSSYAFRNCTSLKRISLPISLNCVGVNGIFNNVTNVEEIHFTKGSGKGIDYGSGSSSSPWYISRNNNMTITFEEGITKIGNYTLNGCIGVKSVTLPNSLTELGTGIFAKSGIEKLEIPQGVTVIKDYTCDGCTNLKEIVLHDNVTSIGSSYAFRNCKSLEKITIPISVNCVGVNGIFNGDTSIKEIHYTPGTGLGIDYSKSPWYDSRTNNITIIFDEGIKKIGNGTLKGCVGTTRIDLPNSLVTLGSNVFSGTGISSIEFPTKITEISSGCFSECKSLIKINISENIVKINDYAFDGCTALQELIIPDNITSIGSSYAFRNCTSLKRISLPISLNCVGVNGIFNNVTNVEEIHFTKGSGKGIDYGSGSSSSPWYISRNNNMTITFEEGITKIGNYTLNGCIGVKSVTLPNSLTELGTGIFAKSGIEKLEIPQGVTVIKDYTCDGCTNLKEIVLHDNVTSIGSSYAFRNCKSLEKITIPISVNCVGVNGIFNGDTSIKEIHYTPGTGFGIDYSKSPWYDSRTNDITIIFDEGIKKIGNNMLKDCIGLKIINYKNIPYTSSSSFSTAFTADGGTISSSAFTGSGF